MGAGAPPWDSVELAYDFVNRTGTSGGQIPMIYDESYQSWRQFGVASQPFWVLFDAAGNQVVARPGAVDFDTVRSVLSS